MSYEFPAVTTRFSLMAAAYPNIVAISNGATSLTYSHLDSMSDLVASKLRALGVTPGSAVIIGMTRSVAAVIAMLGVLKAGGFYVPIDLEYPIEIQRKQADEVGARIAVVLEQDASLIAIDLKVLKLCREGTSRQIESCATPIRGPQITASPEDGAYAMFTSGTTGPPKGVIIPHRAITRLVVDCNYITISPGEKVLHAAPITFDASTFEIWGALLNGGTLVVSEETHFDPILIAALIRSERVSVLWLASPLFNLVVRTNIELFDNVRIVLSGGDILNPLAVASLFSRYPKITVINGYGPTENTTFTCCYTVRGSCASLSAIPLGSFVNGTYGFVFDNDMKPVPVGQIGELYVGGAGLAIGYTRRSNGDPPNFVTAADGTRLYRTGDLVNESPPGVFHFHGRCDGLVKVRGYRFSIEYVRAILLEITNVVEAAVVVQSDGTGANRIAAYLQTDDNVSVTSEHVRAALRKRLPAYMHPDRIFFEISLPKVKSGKIDLKAIDQQWSQSADCSEIHVSANKAWSI